MAHTVLFATAALQDWAICALLTTHVPVPRPATPAAVGGRTSLAATWTRLPAAARVLGRAHAVVDPAHLQMLEHGDDWRDYLLHDSPQAATRIRLRLHQYRLITPYQNAQDALTAGFASIVLGTTGYLFRVGQTLTGLPIPHIAPTWILPATYSPV